MGRLAAGEIRFVDCAYLRSNPTLRRGQQRRLVEREQKAEQPPRNIVEWTLETQPRRNTVHYTNSFTRG
jgi:hypothetical protein